MTGAKVIQHFGNLRIEPYTSQDISPLLPILHQEFPKWDKQRIKSYMNIVIKEDLKSSGVLSAMNDAGYYVGILIYTFQQVSSEQFDYPNNINLNKTFDVFVVENINSCIPILQKKIFMTLVDAAIDVAKNNSCDYIELPTLATESYKLIRDKYVNQIMDPKTFRTYIKISNIDTERPDIDTERPEL